MEFATINTVFAGLALVAGATAATLAVGAPLTRLSSGGRTTWTRFRDAVTPVAAPLAWIVATFCTCASLFLQFGEHLTPCDLCWFQRACMYPEALVLGIAVAVGDRYLVKRYVVPLAGIGAAISVIHINLTAIMGWLNITTLPGCSLAAPCTAQPFTIWGFVTIPVMAMSGFIFIVAMLLLMRDSDIGEA